MKLCVPSLTKKQLIYLLLTISLNRLRICGRLSPYCTAPVKSGSVQGKCLLYDKLKDCTEDQLVDFVHCYRRYIDFTEAEFIDYVDIFASKSDRVSVLHQPMAILP